MNHPFGIYFILALVLMGCGRSESGYIINRTGETLTITLGLNAIHQDPTKYLLSDALNGASSSNHKQDGIDKYFVSYDSLSNELTFKLEAGEQLQLGTLRLDMTRDSIKDWEFHSLRATGDGVNVKVEGVDIMTYDNTNRSLFSQHSHDLILK